VHQRKRDNLKLAHHEEHLPGGTNSQKKKRFDSAGHKLWAEGKKGGKLVLARTAEEKEG